MKIQLFKHWLVLVVSAISLGLFQSQSSGQNCVISFTGSAGNLLNSYIDVYPGYPNSDATFNIFVQDTNNEALPNGTYLSWCVDAGTTLDPTQNNTVPGTYYSGYLLATCDTNLNNELPTNHPASCYVSPATWQQVNYILNHKSGFYFWDIQVAILDLVGGPPPTNNPAYPSFTPANVQALLNGASSNAAAWSPQPGDAVGAVYVITNQSGITLTSPVQLILLEVPYCQVTFTVCPTNLALGCNPTSIPDINTNSVSAISTCGNAVTITGSKSESTFNCANYRYLTYTASDSYGNTATCVQTITWTNDTTAPVIISAPTNGDFGCNPTNLPTDASVAAQVSFSEGCSRATISVSHVDSGSPCAMSRIFTIYATDACGNVSATNYVADTYKIDTTSPVISYVPPSTNLGCTYTNLPTDASVSALIVASDNCSLVGTNVTHVDSTNKLVVSRTFKINVTDGCGNVSSNSTVVYTWTISNGPNISCAADITVTGTNTSPSITGIPSLYDACGNPIICTNGTATLVTNYYNLYYDQFSGSSCVLNGRTPDMADLGGFKWTAGGNWNTTGTQAAVTNCTVNALLPFQPTPGYLYQVSADIECLAGPSTTAGSDWVALGFANGLGTGSTWYSSNNPVGWQLVRNSGNTTYSGQTFMGPGTARASNDGFYPTNITHCSILLDTRPASSNAWTFTYLANGQVVTPTTAFGGSGPSITSVGLGMYATGGGIGHVKNFCVSFAAIVTNAATCNSLSYTDKVVSSTCAGTVHVLRTWYAWDNQGHTNTCTQNIYETIPLPPVKFGPPTTNLGCNPATLPSNVSVTALVVAYGGLSSTNVSYVDSVTSCTVVRTFTVTVKDACGNVSAPATIVYTWTADTTPPVITCPPNITLTNNCTLNLSPSATGWATVVDKCTSTPTLTYCDVTNAGSCSGACTVTRKWTAVDGCGNTSSCTQTITVQVPKASVCVTGPCKSTCGQTGTYTCSVTNCGTIAFSACKVTACGQTFTCPALQPGKSCSISISYKYQSGNVGTYSCQATASCTYSTASSPCTASGSCSTTVAKQ